MRNVTLVILNSLRIVSTKEAFKTLKQYHVCCIMSISDLVVINRECQHSIAAQVMIIINN